MSLPSAWVDKIFTKLAVTYGQRFLGLYAGLDLQAVKDDWGGELRGYAQSPGSIKHALEHLPTEKPPTVLEFKALCRGAPVKALALPPPDFDSEAAQRALAGILKPAAHDPKQWAHDLKAREQRDPKGLSAAQRLMWREALGENRRATK